MKGRDININAIVDTRNELVSVGGKAYTSASTTGVTALHYAALYGKVDIVEFLLEKGAGEY